MRGWAVWAASLTVVLLFNPGAQPWALLTTRATGAHPATVAPHYLEYAN